MKLVDTSAWIEQLRKGGDGAVRQRVEALLRAGEAAWCPVIALELWNGARGAMEYRVLKEMERELPSLPIDGPVWENAHELARRSRTQGVTVPTTDLLVLACARRHGVALEHHDQHFARLSDL